MYNPIDMKSSGWANQSKWISDHLGVRKMGHRKFWAKRGQKISFRSGENVLKFIVAMAIHCEYPNSH